MDTKEDLYVLEQSVLSKNRNTVEGKDECTNLFKLGPGGIGLAGVTPTDPSANRARIFAKQLISREHAKAVQHLYCPSGILAAITAFLLLC